MHDFRTCINLAHVRETKTPATVAPNNPPTTLPPRSPATLDQDLYYIPSAAPEAVIPRAWIQCVTDESPLWICSDMAVSRSSTPGVSFMRYPTAVLCWVGLLD